ncbi:MULTISPECIES: sodium:solute symporter [unclassified Bradyrhizobium]|uniref:sodium:solute symporter family protein n=1 Tax=unclassified Bradyrhizobium TaxID=2631580 RepID=UPI001FF900EC|nr:MULTISPECIES: sodium:solute symporter [unclassified Bradyrhizobium]MCK1367826.1 sodium:solute symporter [Bradyrhizobium sp. 62]MCK1405298.1 sodium:solute symporter [Bradyrhizobium sp. 76]
MNGALPFITAAALLALALGFLASRGKDMNLEQWAVGGRSFGAMFVFLLLAGEIYTTFTFLGGSGYAYGKGAPAYYILCYGTLAYVLSYFMLPPIWRYAKDNQLYSQSDFFARKYDSPMLGLIVALVDVVALIPYLVLQFRGLGIIVEVAGYGAISSSVAVWIGAIIVAAYVMVSGVHGSAWTSVAKDIMIVAVVVFLGIYLPYHYYGGLGSMFAAIEQAKPGFTVLPPHGESLWWFSSTVLLTALGFYMWPHSFASIYTAKNATVIRKNAVVLPLYQLILLFVFLVGFTAALQVPGLAGSNIDLALFKLSVKTFDPWFVGVIGATGVLTALVPGSMILITAATLIANNLYRAVNPLADDRQISRLAKLLVPLVGLVAVFFTLNGGETIVALLLMGYSLVTQLFPSLVLSLAKRNLATREGAAAGILAGVSTVAVVSLTGANFHAVSWLPSQVQDLNIGVVALAVNVAVLCVVSFATRLAAKPSQVAAE